VGAVFYHTKELTWQTQATVGVKYMPVLAENGRAEWFAYPLEVIEFFNTDLMRFGAGLTYQMNPHLRTSGVLGHYSVDMDPAFGYIAQIGFHPKKRQGLSLDLRYTAIKYSGEIDLNGVPQSVHNLDGRSLGVHFAMLF
jgi:hypothetical protein